MDSFPILQKHDAQITALRFRNLRPASDSTVRLHALPNRRTEGALDPGILDQNAVGADAHRLEVLCDLHSRPTSPRAHPRQAWISSRSRYG